MKEALYWKKEKSLVHCVLCPRNCMIAEGRVGTCGVRKNKEGKLFSLVYAKPASIAIDPIEKKPFYHFMPGSSALSFGTVGCNLACQFCQNWTLSTSKPDDIEGGGESVKPEEIVAMAKERGCKIIAYTYNEPTIFYEYMLDTAKLAKKAGIKNVIVSNGYIQQEPLKELCKYIDAANIDLKAFNEEFYSKYTGAKLQPVLETLKTLKKEGVWLEITNLVIPTLNDNFEEIEQMCKWIKENLGQTVLHFSRFFPHHRLNKLPQTPPQTLDKARKIALKYLNHVYVGNIQTDANNTYCPKCKKLLIERSWFAPSLNEIKNGKCPNCKKEISGVWD